MRPPVYAPHLAILQEVQSEAAPSLARKHTGEWLDCAVLKLQKEEWTKGGPGEGVFFSVWIGEKEFKKHRFNYNVHALKLRLWRDFTIRSSEFAEAFRAELDPAPWPNLRTDYGPQTLLQGWLPADTKTFRRDVKRLIKNFTAIHAVVDRLLEARRNRQGINSLRGKAARPFAGR